MEDRAYKFTLLGLLYLQSGQLYSFIDSTTLFGSLNE